MKIFIFLIFYSTLLFLLGWIEWRYSPAGHLSFGEITEEQYCHSFEGTPQFRVPVNCIKYYK